MKRLIISVIIALILLVALMPAAITAAGDPSGSANGTFVIGRHSAQVNSVKLFNSSGTTEVTSMTPQTQYQFKVDVTNVNGLDYLTTLRVIVFYYNGTPTFPDVPIAISTNASSGQKNIVVDNAANFIVGHNVLIKNTTLNEYGVIASILGNTLTLVNNLTNTYTTTARSTVTDMNDMPVTGNSQTLAQFNWNESTNSWMAPSYPPAPGDNGTTTWSIGAFTTPTPTQLANDSNFVFTGQFTPGKVATAGNWYIRVRTTDLENYDGRGNTGALIMNSYDEIDLTTGSLDWGGVDPGLQFTTPPNPLPVTVKYISNGNYSKFVSSSNWTGATHTAILDNTGAASSKDYFSLQSVIGAHTQYVTDTVPYGTLMDNTGTLTNEYGDRPSASMALKLNSSFDQDTYQGNITYYIITR
jgi:hypothetical protein